MCHSCGFCKYGKFDYTVQCRPSSSGNFDPVVNEEQRRRTIATVDGLLTKCDAQYRTLQLHRNTIETMLSALQKNDKSFQVPPPFLYHKYCHSAQKPVSSKRTSVTDPDIVPSQEQNVGQFHKPAYSFDVG